MFDQFNTESQLETDNPHGDPTSFKWPPGPWWTYTTTDPP